MADTAPFNDKIDQEALIKAIMTRLAQDPVFKVGEAEIRGNSYRVFENAPVSVAAFFAECARAHGDAEFLIYEDERYSFADLWMRACRFARALQNECGVKQGDNVALAMRNYPEWMIAYMGVIALGGVVTPLNAWWKGEELHYALHDCGAKIVIGDKRRLEYIAPCKDELGLTFILAREGGADADYHFNAMIEAETDASPPKVEINPDDDFSIVYTSGSTGAPKGVILTNRGCLSTLYSWQLIVLALAEARGGGSLFGDDPGILLAVPLFHVTGSHSIFMLSYLIGRRIVMLYRWDPKEAVAMINREKLTNFVGVPSQSYELIDAVGEEGMPSLIDIGAGGAKRPAEHVKLLTEKFAHARPSSGYGLSETNATGCVISLSDYQERPNSTGRPLPPLTDIRIADDHGEEAPRGTVGEIWIRSASNFRGYLNKPEATEKALTKDGWFRSGDLGKMDEKNYVYIVDRIKDLIIRGGENISTLEVENAIYCHPDVAEASVFSVPDDVLGERVGVAVLPKEGQTLDPAALRDFLSEDLAGFKVPERIWIAPGPLPRLGSAKIDKITVRKIALQHPPALSV